LLDPSATRCTDADIAGFFGQPQEVIRLGEEKQLLLYKYDISSRMRPEDAAGGNVIPNPPL